ncbi:MAG: coenzyme F420-0:L-glutamate ligase, partial [Patescibacteria group bacterium]|nr:coenzyme F420-0:L-glutamate ligase [Patescibacteria group bacterium]
VLWPENPNNAAEVLLAWFKKKYARENLAVVITDSRSQPLRQGVTGFAIGWAGFSPLHDGRNRKDLLGAFSGGSQVNVADSIAAAAVLVMGEANEQTPIVRLRGVPYVTDPHLAQSKNFARDNDLGVDMEKDIFAPFLRSVPWKEGWKKKRVR